MAESIAASPDASRAAEFLHGVRDTLPLMMGSIAFGVIFGTLATGVIYRYPGVLVKTATTLDVLSGGRVNVSVGVGHSP